VKAALVAVLGALSLASPAARAQRADSGAAKGEATPPASFGTLKRDDVSLTVQSQGLTIRALPLTDDVLQTLAPDSYRATKAILDSKAREIEAIRRRLALPAVQPWLVSYFNIQPGEARFDARGVQITSVGRDFRAREVIAVSGAITDGRLAQGRRADAILIFHPDVALAQPLTFTAEGQSAGDWGRIAALLERERAAIRSRAGAARVPPREGSVPLRPAPRSANFQAGGH